MLSCIDVAKKRLGPQMTAEAKELVSRKAYPEVSPLHRLKLTEFPCPRPDKGYNMTLIRI